MIIQATKRFGRLLDRARMALAATILFSFVSFVQAQGVYCVRAGGSGAKNGSDWNNAFPSLPESLQRGATYYIADGNYGAVTFTFTVVIAIITSTSTVSKQASASNGFYIFRVADSTGGGTSINGSVQFIVGDTAGSSVGAYGVTSIKDGLWHHVAATRTGTTLQVYLDGVADGGSTTMSALSIDGLGDFQIGGWLQSPFSLDYFSGLIADLRIYARALSVAEIAGLAGSRLKYSSNTLSLVGYWPLDDGANGTSGDGMTYRDRAGAANVVGNNGANNTGLTNSADSYLSYP
jgi:hypothetical protein